MPQYEKHLIIHHEGQALIPMNEQRWIEQKPGEFHILLYPEFMGD